MIENLIQVEPWPAQGLVLPRIQAHRGYWQGGLQENTLAAFRDARRRGVLMCECDLRLSKDRIPVVFHDEDLSRLGGRPEKVQDLTARELKARVQAPSLAEILTDPQSPRLWNLELKSRNKLDDPLERRVAEVVRAHRAENRILFSSFNPFSLYRMSLHLPDVPRALLVTNAMDPANHWLLRKMWLAPFFNFHILHLDHRMLTPEKMKLWEKRRIPVAVWTVNGAEPIRRFLQLGAISVITDTP